jgi:hypothetical protein
VLYSFLELAFCETRAGVKIVRFEEHRIQAKRGVEFASCAFVLPAQS